MKLQNTPLRATSQCKLTLQNIGLTSVPDNLTDNITEIDLSANAITEMDGFPFYFDLKEVVINRNLLETFPNVSSIGLTLQVLELQQNQISYIDGDILENLPSLDQLVLGGNQIAMFPEVSMPSLRHLFINKIANEWFFCSSNMTD